MCLYFFFFLTKLKYMYIDKNKYLVLINSQEELYVAYNIIKKEIKGENISLLGINESDFYEIKKGPKRKLII